MNDQHSPRDARTPLKCEIEFRRQGDTKYRVDVLDMSPKGCRVAPPVRVEPNDRVMLRLPGIEPIMGSVAWAREWEVGIEFDRPLYPAVFDALVQRMK